MYNSQLLELQDKLTEREADRVMLVEKDAELQQLQEKSAEQEVGFLLLQRIHL